MPRPRMRMIRPIYLTRRLRLQIPRTSNCSVEIADLKPEEHAVPMGQLRIADPAMMMLHIPIVQLKDQSAIRHESFMMRIAMVTLTAQELLIPAAARRNIAHANKGLWTHWKFGD